MRVKAAATIAALLLIACSGSGSTTASSSARTSLPPVGLGSTKAADLRVRLDLLLGEQVLLVAKESAAAAGNTDEYPGYVALLAANTADMREVMRLAFGNTAAQQFAMVWSEQNGDLVEYAVGLVTHKQSLADASLADLNGVFVPAFARLISSLAELPEDQMSHLIAQQLTATEAVIGDAVGQAFSQMYTDLHSAYQLTSEVGDPLVAKTVLMFPDKFPGDPSLHVVSVRVALNTLLQEHAYLTTMATDAVTRSRSSETSAVSTALADNVTALGSVLTEIDGSSTGKSVGRLWSLRDRNLLDYAAGTGTATKDSLVQIFARPFVAAVHVDQASVTDQLVATAAVIDEQRAKVLTTLAADDRGAATAMEPIADGVSAAGSVQG